MRSVLKLLSLYSVFLQLRKDHLSRVIERLEKSFTAHSITESFTRHICKRHGSGYVRTNEAPHISGDVFCLLDQTEMLKPERATRKRLSIPEAKGLGRNANFQSHHNQYQQKICRHSRYDQDAKVSISTMRVYNIQGLPDGSSVQS